MQGQYDAGSAELAAKVLPCQFLVSDLATQLDGGHGLLDGGQGLYEQDLSKGSRIPTQLELCFILAMFFERSGNLTVSVWMAKVACCST